MNRPHLLASICVIAALAAPGSIRADRSSLDTGLPDDVHPSGESAPEWSVGLKELEGACFDYSRTPRRIGQLQLPGECVNVKVTAERAFALCLNRVNYNYWPELHVLDISDPANLRSIAKKRATAQSLGTYGATLSLDAVGPWAYVTANPILESNRTLAVFDARRPESLHVETTIAIGAVGVQATRDHLFVASGGLFVFDLRDPASPQLVWNAPVPRVTTSVRVEGRRAYLGGGSQGFHIVDLTDVDAPIELPPYVGPWISDVAPIGRGEAIVAHNSGIHLVDTSDPAGVKIRSLLQRITRSRKLENTGPWPMVLETQYVPCHDCSLPPYRKAALLDTHPELRYRSYLGGLEAPRDLEFFGDRALVANGAGGVLLLDMSHADAPPVAETALDAFAQCLALRDGMAYVATYDRDYSGLAALEVYELSDPRRPRLAGSVEFGGSPTAIELDGPYAYVAGGSFLTVVDISEPEAPVLVSRTAAGSQDVALAGGRAFLVSATHLWTVDVGDPASPVVEQSLALPGTLNGVATSGPSAYVSTRGSGVHVIDVSQPGSAWLTATYDPGASFTDVAAGGALVYAVETLPAPGLRILDASDPSSPRDVGAVAFQLDNALHSPKREIVVHGRHAYVSAGNAGVQVVDVGDPAAPRLLGTVGTPDRLEGIAVGNGFLGACERTIPGAGDNQYVPGGTLLLAPLQCDRAPEPAGSEAVTDAGGDATIAAREPQLGPPTPNPFGSGTTISFRAPTRGHARLTVHDVAGRRVRVLLDGHVEAGIRRIEWDGRTDQGTPAVAGTYFVRLETGGSASTRKVVRLAPR